MVVGEETEREPLEKECAIVFGPRPDVSNLNHGDGIPIQLPER